MSTQITITLPDEVYQRAERFARLANRDLASVLADTIQLSIPPTRTNSLDLEPNSEPIDMSWSEVIVSYEGIPDFPAFESYRDECLPSCDLASWPTD